MRRIPLAPEASARSLPAKSTRLMRLTWGGQGDLGGSRREFRGEMGV